MLLRLAVFVPLSLFGGWMVAAVLLSAGVVRVEHALFVGTGCSILIEPARRRAGALPERALGSSPTGQFEPGQGGRVFVRTNLDHPVQAVRQAALLRGLRAGQPQVPTGQHFPAAAARSVPRHQLRIA